MRFQGQGDVDQCRDYLDVVWNRLAASDWSLMVKNASVEDSGMYECQVNLVLISDCQQYIIRFLIALDFLTKSIILANEMTKI